MVNGKEEILFYQKKLQRIIIPLHLNILFSFNANLKVSLRFINIALLQNNKHRHKNRINDNKGFINIFFILFFSICFIIQILSNYNGYIVKNNFSSITLKIKGTGNNKIFCSFSDKFNKSDYPNEIYIDGNRQNYINYSYYFNNSDNHVQLIWNNTINNCNNMFYECSNITEIDLSNFDISQVTSMDGMFSNCISLTSLNLSNFNTSQVILKWIIYFIIVNH